MMFPSGFFHYVSSISLLLLKGEYIFSSRNVEKFSLCFRALFNSLFTSIVEPGYIEEHMFRVVGFENGFVCNFNSNINKLSHWIH